jgi:hypothetical protein
MIQSFLRHVATTVAGVILALNGDIFDIDGVKSIGAAVLVATVPVLLRYLNPNDEQFGRLSAPEHIDEH